MNFRCENSFLEWLIDEEDDESFVALCPDEIERNLPDGSLSFSSNDESMAKRVKKKFIIKNSDRIVKPTKVGRVPFQDRLVARLSAMGQGFFFSVEKF